MDSRKEEINESTVKMALFVAIVCRGAQQPISGGENGAWSSFMGYDREEVVNRALHHARTSNERKPNTYKVLLGQLTHEAQIPVTYQLVEI